MRLLGVVVGCGGDDGAVDGCDAYGGADYGDARAAGAAEFLANVVCLGENEKVDFPTPKCFLALGGED